MLERVFWRGRFIILEYYDILVGVTCPWFTEWLSVQSIKSTGVWMPKGEEWVTQFYEYIFEKTSFSRVLNAKCCTSNRRPKCFSTLIRYCYLLKQCCCINCNGGEGNAKGSGLRWYWVTQLHSIAVLFLMYQGHHFVMEGIN